MLYHFPQKVLFKHCDPAGIVFYPRYFEIINDAVERFFEEVLEMPFETMHPVAAVPTASIDIQFRAPSRHGDILDVTLAPTRVGVSSLGLAIVATCQGETRFESRQVLVHVGGSDMRPAPWPEAVRATLVERARQYKEASDAAA